MFFTLASRLLYYTSQHPGHVLHGRVVNVRAWSRSPCFSLHGIILWASSREPMIALENRYFLSIAERLWYGRYIQYSVVGCIETCMKSYHKSIHNWYSHLSIWQWDETCWCKSLFLSVSLLISLFLASLSRADAWGQVWYGMLYLPAHRPRYTQRCS